MVTKAIQTQLIPVAELTPGSVAAIRNEVTKRLVGIASAELNVSPDKLVVRDIRPYSDIGWCSTTDVVTAALTEDYWSATLDVSKASAGSYVGCVTSALTTMADNRWVAIYGVKDYRMCLATPIEQAIGSIRFSVGGNERAIWDLQNMECYRDALAAVSPSAIIIPQNTTFQIYLYGCLGDTGAAGTADLVEYIVLEGIVVEPVGKVLSP